MMDRLTSDRLVELTRARIARSWSGNKDKWSLLPHCDLLCTILIKITARHLIDSRPKPSVLEIFIVEKLA